MAKTKTIEVILGQKGRKEGEGGKDAAAPPKENEVGGRETRGQWVVCPHCGAIRYIIVSGGDFWYTCGVCGGPYFP
jgi:hypothetical protein